MSWRMWYAGLQHFASFLFEKLSQMRIITGLDVLLHYNIANTITSVTPVYFTSQMCILFTLCIQSSEFVLVQDSGRHNWVVFLSSFWALLIFPCSYPLDFVDGYVMLLYMYNFVKFDWLILIAEIQWQSWYCSYANSYDRSRLRFWSNNCAA